MLSIHALTVLAAAMSSLLVEAARDADSVYSKTGVGFKCPDMETIEVTYAESCPRSSKTMRYDNIGASSIAHYDHAPENYKVDDGGYTLMCDYSKSNRIALTCSYKGGSGESLILAPAQDAECPEPGQSESAMKERSLNKRYENTPQYSCPWQSGIDTMFVDSATISSGSASLNNPSMSYECRVKNDQKYTSCAYGADGMLENAPGNVDLEDCPTQLCPVKKNTKRSYKSEVNVKDDPIRSNQVDTASLRHAGKKRMPSPSKRASLDS